MMCYDATTGNGNIVNSRIQYFWTSALFASIIIIDALKDFLIQFVSVSLTIVNEYSGH